MTATTYDDDLATCVGCGLCLPHCPTYRISGDESRSPRGRIEIMKALRNGTVVADRVVDDALESCIQCRGCEPACPSGVPYGRLISRARHDLADRRPHRLLGLGLTVLTRHRLLVAGSRMLALAQRLGLVSRSLLPRRLPLRGGKLPPSSHDPDVLVWRGCVMDAWERDTHRSTAEVVAATGASFAFTPPLCCGALHHHAGRDVSSIVRRFLDSLTGSTPIVVNSAGCGAMLKELGDVSDDPRAASFAERVVDVNEWLAPRIGSLEAQSSPGEVILQDPCHLRHVQKVHGAVRTVVGHVARIVELDDDGLCCGAGGSYSLTNRTDSAAVKRSKIAAIERADRGRGLAVVSANPGCAMQLSGLGHRVVHPVDLLARSIRKPT